MSKLSRFGLLRKTVKSLLGTFKFFPTMTAVDPSTIFKPPASVRGMLQLDRNAFKKEVSIPAVLVPLKSMNKFMKMFKNDAFKSRGALLVDENEVNSNSRWVTMRPDFNFADHPKKMEELGVALSVQQKKLEVRYEHYRHYEILEAILPEGLDSTSGFERVGHIVHLNLREHQRPYKHIIGQVLIDTHKSIRTAVDKSCIIDNTYRNFEMEVIAGEEDFITKVVEFGRSYEFDFSKVFWNSRLQTEHHRVYEAMPAGSTVFDVFAGVGPFSIPLSKKGCKVFANDLNAESYKWLCHNSKLNKTEIEAFNMDGRKFIRECLGKYLRSKPPTKNKIFVAMNLPGHAIDFLDAFRGLLSVEKNRSDDINLVDDSDLPIIHIFCYVFSSAEDKLGDIRVRAAKGLGEPLPGKHTIRDVRKVSPSKEQYCLSFDMQTTVLRTYELNEADLEPEPKRQKIFESSRAT